MVIDLMLGSESFVHHDQVVVLPDDVLLNVRRTARNNGDLIAVVKGSGRTVRFPVREKPIDITDLCQIPGKVEISINLHVRGEVARTWQVEPLCVKEIPDGTIIVPQIAALESRVETLERALRELLILIKE